MARTRATWTQAHVRRLSWRAGFGATPREAARWARRGRSATLHHVLAGDGHGLRGPAPKIDGKPLDPVNEYGHAVLWWLDRMVRTQHPLVEKLALFWHDHFATGGEEMPLMLAQNRTLRDYALGNFREFLGAVTRDPAMQFFLSLADSDKDAPNENYARELMELFTIGSGYDEQDVREAARALTGYQANYKNDRFVGITFDPERHDDGVKRIFGKRGRFGPGDVLDLVTAHPRHAPFLVRKLWDFFIDEPPSKGTLRELERVYRGSRLELQPVVAAILAHPALYKDLNAPGMVKSPVVFLAGALRATGQGIDRDAWTWLLTLMGQMPFDPPSVAGWDWGPAWLSTNSVRARFSCGNYLTERGIAAVPDGAGRPGDKPAQALGRALAATGQPWISARTRTAFLELAHGYFAGVRADDRQGRQTRADMLQRSLRHLLLTGPDAQLH